MTTSTEHARFIDALGGPTAVITYINDRRGTNLTANSASNWKVRGIPHKHRGILVALAQEKNVVQPKDFFDINGEG